MGRSLALARAIPAWHGTANCPLKTNKLARARDPRERASTLLAASGAHDSAACFPLSRYKEGTFLDSYLKTWPRRACRSKADDSPPPFDVNRAEEIVSHQNTLQN